MCFVILLSIHTCHLWVCCCYSKLTLDVLVKRVSKFSPLRSFHNAFFFKTYLFSNVCKKYKSTSISCTLCRSMSSCLFPGVFWFSFRWPLNGRSKQILLIEKNEMLKKKKLPEFVPRNWMGFCLMKSEWVLFQNFWFSSVCATWGWGEGSMEKRPYASWHALTWT